VPIRCRRPLVCCNHLENVFYAIEACRALGVGEVAFGTVLDPLAVATGPELRRWLWQEARKQGISAMELLERIPWERMDS
jgi:hypothetical protein